MIFMGIQIRETGKHGRIKIWVTESNKQPIYFESGEFRGIAGRKRCPRFRKYDESSVD
jgi:hypothetical protein